MTGYIIMCGGLVLVVVGSIFVAIARSKVRKARTSSLSRGPQFERPIFLVGDAFGDRRPEALGPSDSLPPRARAEAGETDDDGGESNNAIPPL